MTAPAFSPCTLEQAHAHVEAVVKRSGTSFAMGMKILPPQPRLAMFALYAFGREVDDVADEPGDAAPKLVELEAWREEVGRLYAGAPTRPTTLALLDPVRRYDLPRAEFFALIDGMEMDARDALVAPDRATLGLYCRRVAGTVGLLSLPVFGARGEMAEQFALALADGLQLTNILRDIAEDAARGRLYLPRETLAAHGISPGLTPAQVVRHPGLAGVARDLAREAREAFAAADRALIRCNRHALRPALLMMGIYVGILDRLERADWGRGPPVLAMSKLAKIRAALFQGLWRRSWQPST